MIYMMYLSGERRKSVTFALDYDSDSELDDCNQGKFNFVDSIEILKMMRAESFVMK